MRPISDPTTIYKVQLTHASHDLVWYMHGLLFKQLILLHLGHVLYNVPRGHYIYLKLSKLHDHTFIVLDHEQNRRWNNFSCRWWQQDHHNLYGNCGQHWYWVNYEWSLNVSSDLPSRLCQQCILNTTRWIYLKCNSSKEAIIYYNHYILHYSYGYFFGNVEESPTFQMLNVTTISSHVPEQE